MAVIRTVALPRGRVAVGLALLASVGTVAGSCSGSKPEATAEQRRTDTMSADAASPDTTAPDTGTDADSSRARPESVPPGPAPGTVRVRAAVDSCDTAASPVHCRLRIEEILAYGSATPTIGTGLRTVRFASGQLADRAAASLSNLHIYVLRHAGDRPAMGGGKNRVEWSVQSIEQN